MSSTSTYEYDGSLQERILALILKEPRLVNSRRDVLEASFFEDSHLVTLARLGLEYWDRHRELPSRDMMRVLVAEWAQAVSLPGEMRATVAMRAEHIYDLSVQDVPGVTERVVRFAQRQALRQAIDKTIGLLQRDEDLSRAKSLVEQALLVGHNAGYAGSSVISGVDTLPQRAQASELKHAKIKTLFNDLDTAALGGPRQTETWLVMALPGGGKSAMLTHLAANAVRQGYSVAHATLGDLHEEAQEVRAVARLLKIPQRDILAGTKEYWDRVPLIKDLKSNWYIRYWPSESASVDDIRAWLTHLTSVMGVHIDMLVIDYIGELKPLTDNSYNSFGSQFSGLGQLGDDFGVLTWTGAQVTRKGADLGSDDVLTMSMLAESWKSAFKIDGCISWNQTPAEYAAGRGRLWVDKVRRGRSKLLIPLDSDYERMFFKQRS